MFTVFAMPALCIRITMSAMYSSVRPLTCPAAANSEMIIHEILPSEMRRDVIAQLLQALSKPQ